jgi:hypothetical protein
MKTSDWLNDFVGKNIWGIILILAGAIVFYTSINLKVKALEEQVTNATSLIERVIVLEERQKNEQKTLDEIKSDVKEIKNGLNIHLQNDKGL